MRAAVALIVALAACGSLETREPSIPERELAPAFSLTDHTGAAVTLADLTAEGPAVLVFYRGHW